MWFIVIGYLNTFHTLLKPISNIYSFPLSREHLLMTFMMICSVIVAIYNVVFFHLTFVSIRVPSHAEILLTTFKIGFSELFSFQR